MTIIKTSTARIDDRIVNVNTLKGSDRQDIYYEIDGSVYSFNYFWSLNPHFIDIKTVKAKG